MKTLLRQSGTGLRMLLLLTVVLGVIYPLVITLVAQVPGLKSRANGSLVSRNGTVVGSALIGQSFTDAKGNPLPDPSVKATPAPPACSLRSACAASRSAS